MNLHQNKLKIVNNKKANYLIVGVRLIFIIIIMIVILAIITLSYKKQAKSLDKNKLGFHFFFFFFVRYLIAIVETHTFKGNNVKIIKRKNKMKKISLLIIMIIHLLSFNKAQSSTLCCQGQTTTYTITEDCCVNAIFEVDWRTWYGCDSADVVFWIWNSETNNWDEVGFQTITTQGVHVIEQKICPINGENQVKFRVRIKDVGLHDIISEYACYASPYDDITVDLSECCQCYNSVPNNDTWLNFSTVSPSSCTGCEVQVDLTLPSTASCYTKFIYYTEIDGEYNDYGETPQYINPTNLNNALSLCINEGEEYTVFLGLMKENSTNYDCLIEKNYTCEPDTCDCPEDVNDWLTLTADKGTGDCDTNDCYITYDLDIPSNINCYNFYQVERVEGSSTVTSPKEPLGLGQLSMIEGCLDAGQDLTITLSLFESMQDTVPCIIEKSVDCPGTPIDTVQVEPCLPDCFDDHFITPYEQETFDGILGCDAAGDCEITVTWTYRIACGTWQDIQIMGIETSDECFDSCDEKDIYQRAVALAVERTLALEPDWEPNSFPECSTIWRVAGGSCRAEWQYSLIINEVVVAVRTRLETCTNSSCCLQPMTVCDYGTSLEITYDTNYVTPLYDCHNAYYQIPEDSTIVECDPACDWNLIDDTFAKQGTTSQKISTPIEDVTKNPNAFGVRTTYSNDLVNVWIRSHKEEKVKIELYDLNGKRMEAINSELVSGENAYSMQVSDLNSGMYILSIEIDGVRLESIQIPITK